MKGLRHSSAPRTRAATSSQHSKCDSSIHYQTEHAEPCESSGTLLNRANSRGALGSSAKLVLQQGLDYVPNVSLSILDLPLRQLKFSTSNIAPQVDYSTTQFRLGSKENISPIAKRYTTSQLHLPYL